MLYNTTKLKYNTQLSNTINLLESLPYIETEFSVPNPAVIPLIESAEYGKYVVRYKDLLSLTEEYDISIDESIDLITEYNIIKKDNIIVAIEEWRPYINQNILTEFSNEYVLLREIGTPAYILCEICMECYNDTNDEGFLNDYISEPRTLLEYLETLGDKIKDPGVLEGELDRTNYALKKVEEMILHPKTDESTKQKYRTRMAEMIKKKDALNKAIKERNSLTPSNSNNTDNTSQPQSNDKSWFAQKWSAFKNWLGGSNEEGKSKGWFSNLIGKIKSGFGIGQNNTNNNTNSISSDAAKQADTKVEEKKEAQPAQPVNNTNPQPQTNTENKPTVTPTTPTQTKT